MEFLLPFHPKNTATLLDNSTHWLRSAIQFKWSIAEHEIYRIRTALIGESRDRRGYISRDIKDLWKARRSKKVRSYEHELSEVRSAHERIVDDRNTIVHGNIEILPQSNEFYVPDSRVSMTSDLIPFYRPGRVVMVRGENNVDQNAIALRGINEKADQLLSAIYSMWIALDPRYEVEGEIRIDSASSPDIGFGPNAEKTARIARGFNLSDVPNQEGTDQGVGKECPECNIAAIENGQMCSHMAMADYYENGRSLILTVQIPEARSMLEQLNQVGANDLILEFSLDTGEFKIRCKKSVS